MQMPGLLRWSARRLRSARCGRRRGPAVPRRSRPSVVVGPCPAALPLSLAFPLRVFAPPGAGGSPRVCGRGPRRSVAVAAFPVRRSSSVVLRRSGLRSPAPVVRPPLRLRGAGGGGFAAAFCARPPVAWGGRSWGGALRVVGFAHPPPVPRPPGRGRRRVTNPLRRGFWPFGPDFRRKVGNHG